MSAPSNSTTPSSVSQDAEDAVEERRLAGAVRADQSDALALLDVDVDGIERDDAGERLADAAGGEQGHETDSSIEAGSPADGPVRGGVFAAALAAFFARRSAERAFDISITPSGCFAYWIVPRPNRMNRHFGEIGKTLGMRLGVTEDPAEDRALEDELVHQRERTGGVQRARRPAGAERDDEHEPEQRSERERS